MSVFLYNVGIFLYGLAIRISSLFNEKARKWIEGRQGLFLSLQKETCKETFWFHCASVGEFEQGYPLLCLMKKAILRRPFL
ncbi:hypothetical protein EMGBS15_07990 [Filimonas sp.]|nr:hypothetical protein EMGBS15_07990 [Filimonas sp.]